WGIHAPIGNLCIRAEIPLMSCRPVRRLSGRARGSAMLQALVLLLILLALPGPQASATGADAGFTLAMTLGRWAGPGILLEDLSIHLRDRPGQGHWKLTASRADLPTPVGSVRDLVLECRDGQLTGSVIECRDGRLSASHPFLTLVDVPVSFRHEVDGASEVALGAIPLAGGNMELRGRWADGQWSGAGEFSDVRLDDPLWSRWLDAWKPAGTLTGEWQLAGRGTRPETGQLRVDLSEGGFAAASGLQAAEALRVSATLQLASDAASGRSLSGSIAWPAGGLYVDPVFVEPGKAPITLAFSGELDDDLALKGVQLRARDPGRLSLVAEMDRWAAGMALVEQPIRVESFEADLAAAWPHYLRPFLLGSSWEEISLAGTVAGTARLDDAGLASVSATLTGMALTDPLERVAFREGAGRLDWSRDAPRQSHFQIGPGQLFGLPTGPVIVPFETEGMRLALAQRVRLPLLDGALRFDRLGLDLTDPAAPRADLSLTVEPLSMRRFSEAVGLPPFEGLLAGNIPRLSLADGHLVLDGQLVAQLFDGVLLIENFALSDPFGRQPVLQADVRLRGLDLEPLTEAFSFGRIEGRLDGRVADLWMQNWQPVAFDARFETPADEPGRRRISQRAVDNLTELGGGVGGALGAGFLGFFEDFRYRRLGLGCRLADGVCYMEGVSPADGGGYYIVEGAGLPRIDVIGFTREVGWADLVSRLAAVSRSGAPSIEMP
ncbi:MAG: hypothetical protein ACP5DC_09765, partial [Halothiobacillaceae bacterium]